MHLLVFHPLSCSPALAPGFAAGDDGEGNHHNEVPSKPAHGTWVKVGVKGWCSSWAWVYKEWEGGGRGTVLYMDVYRRLHLMSSPAAVEQDKKQEASGLTTQDYINSVSKEQERWKQICSGYRRSTTISAYLHYLIEFWRKEITLGSMWTFLSVGSESGGMQLMCVHCIPAPDFSNSIFYLYQHRHLSVLLRVTLWVLPSYK